MEDVDSRVEPFGQSLVGITGLIEPGDLFSKDREDGIGRMTGFKLGK